jgi:hypothetical protein
MNSRSLVALRSIHQILAVLCVAAGASACVTGNALAAAAALGLEAAQQPVRQLHALGEVRVYGNEHLARSIFAAEDDFFRLYNKLNQNDDYHITCGHIALSSGMVRRQCGAPFLPDDVAIRSYAAGTCAGMVTGCSAVGTAFHVPGPTEAIAPALMERPNTYENNLLKVINSDPQLLQKYHHLLGLYREMDANQHQHAALNP